MWHSKSGNGKVSVERSQNLESKNVYLDCQLHLYSFKNFCKMQRRDTGFLTFKENGFAEINSSIAVG